MSVFIQRSVNPKHTALALKLCNERVSAQTRDKFEKFTAPSKEIWRLATDAQRKAGKGLRLPYEIKKSTKTYALDGLVVARTLGIPDSESLVPLQIFSLYYLAVHVIDDLVEDDAKFRSHFKFTGEDEERTNKQVLPFSYTLNALQSIYKMLMDNSMYAKNTDEIFAHILETLGGFTHFFLLESLELPPEKIFQIKEREVSGVATSMVADLLCLEQRFNRRVAVNIKQALMYLGSLTQFTDDLRDYDVDRANGNANLLVGFEKKLGESGLDTFVEWYLEEEERMLESFRNSGLTLDLELIRAIPWYPSFVTSL